jgi:serine protease Do
MKAFLLKLSALSAIVLLLHCPAFAQDDQDHDSTSGKLGDDDEIVIKPKTDKDVKLIIEIKDGHAFIDGKPVDQFDDENVFVRKKKIMVVDGRTITFSGDGANPDVLTIPEPPQSPFRSRGGARSYNMDKMMDKAFLGVKSENPDGNTEGAKITEVTKGSAAEKAGLRTGDLITKINDTTLSNPGDLSRIIGRHKPEDKISITYTRDGKQQKTNVTLGKFKMSFNYNYNYSMPKVEDFNFSMPPMSGLGDGSPRAFAMPRGFSWDDDSPKLGIKAQDTEDGKGVKVLDVDDDSPAEKAGIKEDDIITRFDGKEVNSATELADLAKDSKEKPSVKISVIREGKPMELEIKTPKKLKTADL